MTLIIIQDRVIKYELYLFDNSGVISVGRDFNF